MVECYRFGSFIDERWQDDFYSNLIIVDESRLLKKYFLDELAYRLKRGLSIQKYLDMNTVGKYTAKFERSNGYTKVILKRKFFLAR